jgi:hypothetical protein|tara:strand:+ start:2839 stop:3105 length:267 start_codon:yes stop_codon:yes gene_type:complete
VQEEPKRYRVYEGVGVPPPANPGPRRKWGDLPLEEVAVGDLIEMPMNKEEVDELINSIRSYVYRVSRKTGKKFTVRKTDYGIGIWRMQ